MVAVKKKGIGIVKQLGFLTLKLSKLKIWPFLIDAVSFIDYIEIPMPKVWQIWKVLYFYYFLNSQKTTHVTHFKFLKYY